MNICADCGEPAVVQAHSVWRCLACRWKWLDRVKRGEIPPPEQSEMLAWARLVTHKNAVLNTPEDLACWLVQLGLAIRYDRGDMQNEALSAKEPRA